jgi:predicted ferric reductase
MGRLVARQIVAESLASLAVLLLAGAQLLATRARFLERLFGGLDKLYKLHRVAGQSGMALLAGHVALIPWRLASPGGVPSGLLAFAGLTTLAILTFSKLRYGIWRRTHKFMGLFFAIGLAHTLLVDSALRSVRAPLIAVYATGIAAYVYGTLLARAVRRIRRYEVVHVTAIAGDTVEIALRPRKRRIAHAAGQFVFVRFHRRGLREPHPFTVSSAPTDDLVHLTVRAAGDFTSQLARLEPGDRATVEGGYGRFDFRRGGARQLWIAGGVGVTPFLSWLRDLGDAPAQRIDFHYAVRTRGEALYWNEIQAIAARYDRIEAHLHVSSEQGRLTAEDLDPRGRSVFLCGPASMVEALRDALKRRGARDVHAEEFRFR